MKGECPAATGESLSWTEEEYHAAGEGLARTAEEYRAVIGARPDQGMVVRDERGLLSGGLTEESINAFADYAAEVTPTGSNTRGSAAYRTHLIRVFTERKLLELGRRQTERPIFACSGVDGMPAKADGEVS